MAETIRDVTIRVSLKQVQGEPLKVPRLEQANAEFNETSDLLTAIQTEVQTTFNVFQQSISIVDVSEISSSVATLQEAVQSLKAHVAGIGPESKSSIDLLIDAFEDAGDDAELLTIALHDAQSTLEKLGDNGGDDVGKLRRAVVEAQQRLSDLRDKAIKAALGVGEGFRSAGEGALTFARAATSLFSTTDEQAQQTLETITRVRQGFELFKGSFETVKGLTEASISLKQATGAINVVQAIHIAGTKVLTIVLGEATVAALGLNTALGPVVLGAAALAAAGAAVWGAWKVFFSEAPDEAQKLKVDLDGLRSSVDDLSDGLETSLQFDTDTSSALEALRFQREAAELRNESFDTAKKLEALRVQSAEAAARQERDALTLATERWNLTRKEFGNKTQADVDLKNANNFVTSSEKQRDLAAISLRHQQSQRDLAREQLATEKRMQQVAERTLQTKQRQLDTVKKRIEADREDQKSFEARFGELSAEDQQSVKDIGAHGGPRNQDEAELLRRVGANELAQEFSAQQGREAGADATLARQLGLGRSVKEQKADQAEVNRLQQDVNRLPDEIKRSSNKSADILDNLANNLIPAVQEQEKRLNESEKKVQQALDDLQEEKTRRQGAAA